MIGPGSTADLSSLASQQPSTLISFVGCTVKTFFASLARWFSISFPSMLLIFTVIAIISTDSRRFRRPGYTVNSICLFLVCLHKVLLQALSALQTSNSSLANLIRATELEHHWPRGLIFGVFLAIIPAIIYPCILVSLILQLRFVFMDNEETRFAVTLSMSLLTAAVEVWYFGYRRALYSRPTFGIPVTSLPEKRTFDTWFTLAVCICCTLLLCKICNIIKTSQGWRGFRTFRSLRLLITYLLCIIGPGNALFQLLSDG
jgi:Fungal pheromone mating factor STE2 GPCR